MIICEGLEKKDGDILYDYLHLEDIDGNKIDSWNFVNKIAVAENCDEDFILDKAKEFGYNIFKVEAPSFCRFAVACKNIDEEDIYDDYAQYLEGVTVAILKMKW